MQRYKSKYTGPQMDVAFDRALPGGAIDLSLSNKANVPHEITHAGSLNDYTTPGQYYCPWNSLSSQMQNMPPGLSDAFALLVELGPSGEPVQCYKSGFNQLTYTRFKSYYNTASGWVDTWSPWVQIATSTPPTERNLTLASGLTVTPGRSCTFSKNQEGRVFVEIAAVSASNYTNNQKIFTIQSGFCPKKKTLRNGNIDQGGTEPHPCHIIIDTDGVAKVCDMPSQGGQYLVADFSYQAD